METAAFLLLLLIARAGTGPHPFPLSRQQVQSLGSDFDCLL